MKPKVRMIVTDLDGTFLRTDKTVSAKTVEIIEKCREEGIKIVFATGRGGSADRIVPSCLFDGKITMNGAVGRVGDKVIHSFLIPCLTARSFLVACNEYGIKITSEINGMHYSNFVVSDFWPSLTNYKVVDFMSHEMDAEKIYSPNPTYEEMQFIKQHLPESLYSVATADITGDLLQIMHKGATKSQAVAALAAFWDIASSEIVAFGDELNDVDMLKYAGVGVAMGNALEEVKAISNTSCLTNDDDGVAKWIEGNIIL